MVRCLPTSPILRELLMPPYGRYDYGFPRQPTVGERKALSKLAVRELRKSNPDIKPVEIEGRRIAVTWWGKSWNENLERYADFSNRVARGRSYARHGSVIDLQVTSGCVNALVQGSRGDPYEVEVTIKALASATWTRLRELSSSRIDSLPQLLGGSFPADLKDAFFAESSGLFPEPKEISFSCSCPDWASMCKHVAAVLYGVGNRLDSEPGMLFTLRQVTLEDLLATSIEAATSGLLARADASSADVLDDADLSDVFGIEMEAGDFSSVSLPAPEALPASLPSPTSVGAPQHGKMREQFMRAVGAISGEICQANAQAVLPEWTRNQVAGCIQRLVAEGQLRRVGRGHFEKVGH